MAHDSSRRRFLALCSGVASAGLMGYDSSVTGARAQESRFTGVQHRAIGGAELRGDDDGLRVAVPEQERGGLRSVLGNAEGYDVSWASFGREDLPDRGLVLASGNGVVSREGADERERRWLGSTAALKRGDEISIVTDYEPLESEAQLLAVVRDGEVVEQIEGYDQRLKAVVRRFPDGCGKIPPRLPDPFPICYIWRWDETIEMDVPDVGTIEGSEIRILAEDSPYGLASLDQFDVRLGGISPLTVTSDSVRYG